MRETMQPATRSCGCAAIGKRRAVAQGTPNNTTHASDHTSKRQVAYPDPEKEPIDSVWGRAVADIPTSAASSSPYPKGRGRANTPVGTPMR